LRDGELVLVDVELGLRTWKFAEVKQGLEAGESVVIALDRVEIKAGIRAVALPQDEDLGK
jgi:hypothetical protein